MIFKQLLIKLRIIKQDPVLVELYKPYKSYAFTDCNNNWRLRTVKIDPKNKHYQEGY